jgi:hypothetical protein
MTKYRITTNGAEWRLERRVWPWWYVIRHYPTLERAQLARAQFKQGELDREELRKVKWAVVE